MFWLGLLLPLAFIPGYTGVSIPTQWAVLSVALLPALWHHSDLRAVHWLGLAFLGFAAVSLLWSPDFGFGLWIAAIWGLSFWYGWTSYGFLPLWKGLAVGLWINSAVAIFQAMGYAPVLINGPMPAGLMFNSAVLSACGALVAVALICHAQWHYLPGLYPALWLGHSRGAWAVIMLAVVAKYLHWSAAVGLMAVGGVVLYLDHGQSDFVRLQFWDMALHNLTWFGNGAGSFNSIYTWYNGAAFHPENVHNDYLQLIYEFGVVGLVPIGIVLAALMGTKAKDWPVLFAFGATGLFYFPLWTAIPSFMGCAVAGHILRYYGPDFSVLRRWGSYLVPRGDDWEWITCAAWGRDIPDFEGITDKAMKEKASHG